MQLLKNIKILTYPLVEQHSIQLKHRRVVPKQYNIQKLISNTVPKIKNKITYIKAQINPQKLFNSELKCKRVNIQNTFTIFEKKIQHFQELINKKSENIKTSLSLNKKIYTQIKSYKYQITILQERENLQISTNKVLQVRSLQEKQSIQKLLKVFEYNINSRLSNLETLLEKYKDKVLIITPRFPEVKIKIQQYLKFSYNLMQNRNKKLEFILEKRMEDMILKITEAIKIINFNVERFMSRNRKHCGKEKKLLLSKIDVQNSSEEQLKKKEILNSQNKQARKLLKINKTMRIPAKSSPVPSEKSEECFSSREEQKSIPFEISEQSQDGSPSFSLCRRTISATSLFSSPVGRHSSLSRISDFSLKSDAKFKHVRSHILHCIELIPSKVIKRLEALIVALYNLLELSISEIQAIERARSSAKFDLVPKSGGFLPFFK